MHRADGAQHRTLLQQALVNFSGWLITIRRTTKRPRDLDSFSRRQGPWLRCRLATPTVRMSADQTSAALIDAAAIEFQRRAGPSQRQPLGSLFNGHLHSVFPLFERSTMDKTFFWISRQSLAVCRSPSSLATCFCRISICRCSADFNGAGPGADLFSPARPLLAYSRRQSAS